MMREHKVSVKSGAVPYPDGSGFAHDIEVDEKYIWIDQGAVMIDPKNWPALRSAIDTAVEAFSNLPTPPKK
jgi:hypothetical protein